MHEHIGDAPGFNSAHVELLRSATSILRSFALWLCHCCLTGSPIPHATAARQHALALSPAQYTWLLILMNVPGYLFQLWIQQIKMMFRADNNILGYLFQWKFRWHIAETLRILHVFPQWTNLHGNTSTVFKQHATKELVLYFTPVCS